MLALKPSPKGHLIITAGALGAYYESAGVFWHVPTPSVAVVDTTGAGDNFHGALALSLSKSAALEEAVKFSVAVASLTCSELGGRRGLPGWEEAMALSAELVSQVIHS
jgi:sulfofructose kinase